ncbi:MAG TPA: ABC transporter ATP-binding protein [Cyclobacteriaceae bacterium]|nr:ABC transporter ATP-binding protein [Cyclobacteriaceae bacterium]
MLKVQGVTKSYASLKVLKGIDFEVSHGEVVSIVGASGAGKSTLLHILGTLDNPDNGTVFLNDTNLFSLKGNQLSKFRNRHIGFIFQFHNLLPEFTALENVCIPGFIAGSKDNEVVGNARELLDLLGLTGRLDHKPSELSGGEQQRIAVARALLNRPEIILADEPSGNLDSKNAEELHSLFFKLRNDLKLTIIIVTHNKELAHMADRKLEIKDGVILR